MRRHGPRSPCASAARPCWKLWPSRAWGKRSSAPAIEAASTTKTMFAAGPKHAARRLPQLRRVVGERRRRDDVISGRLDRRASARARRPGDRRGARGSDRGTRRAKPPRAPRRAAPGELRRRDRESLRRARERLLALLASIFAAVELLCASRSRRPARLPPLPAPRVAAAASGARARPRAVRASPRRRARASASASAVARLTAPASSIPLARVDRGPHRLPQIPVQQEEQERKLTT